MGVCDVQSREESDLTRAMGCETRLLGQMGTSTASSDTALVRSRETTEAVPWIRVSIVSLCDGCRHVFWFERANGTRTYHCRLTADLRAIPGDVVACSSFDPKDQADLWDLKEIAWRMTPGPNGRIKGFQPPKDER
jgi:hypothetical protein